MTAEKNIEDKLEELGQAIGSDESLVENVMSRIDAKPIAESNRTDKSKNKLLLRRFVMNRLTKLAAAAVITIAVLIGIHHFKGSVDLATPAFAKMITPAAGEPKGFGEIGVPVNIGGIKVFPGDWIVGDDDGVMVLPDKKAIEFTNRAMDVLERENRIRKEIKEGGTLGKLTELLKWEKQ